MDKRLLIKLSGETLIDHDGWGISKSALDKIALELKELQEARFQVGVVLGGGNLFRGQQKKEALSLRRAQADQVGMIATLMNGLLLSETLKFHHIPHKLLSAIQCDFIERYSDESMQRSLEKQEILLFVGGTGHPFFTTDSAAAIRASEMGATLLLKATTKVDGIYSKDPRVFSDAVKYQKISYQRALDEKLQILDMSAFALCMENKIAIRVYKYGDHSFLEAATSGCGSLVTGGEGI